MPAAIILAGGASGRMGRPKALLTCRGDSFIRRITRLYTAAGVTPVVTVLGASAPELLASGEFTGTRTIVNPRWEEGQLTSIQAGIGALDPSMVDGAFIHPVDHPLVCDATIEVLLRATLEYPDHILIPTYRERRGHPAIFPVSRFAALLGAPIDQGARYVLQQTPQAIHHIPVDDPGVTADIDTPEDYSAWCHEPAH